jgi:hypothetical protein
MRTRRIPRFLLIAVCTLPLLATGECIAIATRSIIIDAARDALGLPPLNDTTGP